MSNVTQKFTEDSVAEKIRPKLNEVPNDFIKQIMTALNVASKAKEIFKSSEVSVKRQLLTYCF